MGLPTQDTPSSLFPWSYLLHVQLPNPSWSGFSVFQSSVFVKQAHLCNAHAQRRRGVFSEAQLKPGTQGPRCLNCLNCQQMVRSKAR